ncbi:MAG TPA: dimethylsulfonioproprionate lyase family protein [Gaiellales bacterium]|jgi:hypothetical protein
MVRKGSDGSLEALIAALADTLAPERDARHAPFAAALETIVPAFDAAPETRSLPVLEHWTRSLTLPAPAPVEALARALDDLRPALAFTQNPNYVAAPPSPGFLDRYGYAVLAGPAEGPPALVRHPSLALGVLLLAPATRYPTHVHPAAELYLPLGPAGWSLGDGALVVRPAGTPIVHAPNEPHATETGATPLAALYLWIGEISVAATLVTPP